VRERDQLLKLSARVGADPLLVQASGGNTSIKDDGVLWVKASGTWLKDALAKDIFVPVDIEPVRRGVATADPACESCLSFVRKDLATTDLRPSIETTFHAILRQRVVVHVHCVNTIAHAVRQDAEEILSSKLAGINWSFVPYARPGLPLTHGIVKNLKPDSNVIILGNHGLIVTGENVGETEALLETVVRKLTVQPCDYSNHTNLPAHDGYMPAEHDDTHALAHDVRITTPYFPDQVVFLGAEIGTSLESQTPVIALPKRGVLIKKDSNPAAEAMARCVSDVLRRIPMDAALNSLTGQDIANLTNWDAEKYRQNLAKI
jgi:rhamnose utilization protein RhaD (predicted bifunctional aldolase and dehydrogenase)